MGRRSIVNAPNARINPKIVDVDGSDLNLLIQAAAIMGEACVASFADKFTGVFVDTSRGAQTDRVVYDRYTLLRFPATAATVDLSLRRPTAAAGAGVVSAGTRVQTPSGIQFATDVDVSFGALDVVHEVSATALITGPGSRVGDSTLTQFVDQPFDATLTVINFSAAAGGNNVENQPSFKGRARDFFRAVRRGTIGAIEFGPRQVPGIQVSRAFEIVNPVGGDVFPAAAVQDIIADADGHSSSFLENKARNELLNWRAAGIPVYVSGGVVAFENVIWRLGFATDTDTVLIQQKVRALSVAAAQNLAPGAKLLRASLIAVARTVPGAIINDDSLIEPAGDVTPSSNTEVIRIRPQDVAFSG